MGHSLMRRMLIRTRDREDCRAALFLDRDGVIIEDMHYIKRSCDVRLCRGAADLVEYCNKINMPVVVITNQSGISRGYFTWYDYEQVTTRMIELLGNKAKLTAIYANGYGPSHQSATWRKPSCGMVLAAAKELHLDVASSILIGDRLSDMECGYSAGVKKLVHVKTGKGDAERDLVNQWWRSKVEISENRTKDISLAEIESLAEGAAEFLID